MENPKGYVIFQDQIAEAINNYPGLSSFIKDGVPGLTGEIELMDVDGDHLDIYSIEILATENFPNSFPLLFEAGGKIPKNYDWHVYETDGHCCIKTTPEEILACKRGITLNSFIEEEVKPYLFNQTFRRLNGYFYQERSHGFLGTLEYLQEVFKTKNINLIKNGFLFISRRNTPSRTSMCFCGSGEKYRKCHRHAFETFSVLSDDQLNMILLQIQQYIKNHYSSCYNTT
jgi:hypothetical protein